jgi:glutathione S-transferase
MTIQFPVALRGVPGSPYTRKMLSVLRYRHIPYRYLIRPHGRVEGLPSPKVELLPTFYLPAEEGHLEAVVDSTPIIRRLEREVHGRSVVPTDPVLRYVDEFLEDFGDEWLTKAMFYYRWAFEADIAQAASILPRWANLTGADDAIARGGAFVSKRQIERLYVVGSNATTAPIIEKNYEAFLDVFDAHLNACPFLMGSRPGASDFAVFGQLTQLAHFDPTPTRLALERAPRVYAWVDVMEDLSGLDPRDDDWLDSRALPATLKDMLRLAGRVYIPLLVANAATVNAGKKRVETEIDGAPWVQEPNTYQAKCLLWLRRSFGDLEPADAAAIRDLLAETGCSALLDAKV